MSATESADDTKTELPKGWREWLAFAVGAICFMSFCFGLVFWDAALSDPTSRARACAAGSGGTMKNYDLILNPHDCGEWRATQKKVCSGSIAGRPNNRDDEAGLCRFFEHSTEGKAP